MKLKEGALYCEGCGQEIQIVPEFEPEIENSIHATLSGMATEIDPEDSMESETLSHFSGSGLCGFQKNKKKVFGLFFLLPLLICLTAVFFILENSPSYQYEKALKFAEQKNYSSAEKCLEKALRENPNNLMYLDALSANCYALEDYAHTEDICRQIIDLDSANENAYRRLISVLEKKQRYAEINSLLLACEEPAIVNKYLDYIANPPAFSLESGIYHEKMVLKLIANTNGTIYYTVNGNNPLTDDNAIPYTSPIELENGNYKIQAYFINSKGIASAISDSEYYIDITIPDKPVITPKRGAYSSPQMITVEIPEGCRVFYSTDGSKPSMDSTEYTEPIPMPLGNSTFHFITYSMAGAASEISSVRYTLNLHASLNTEAARNKLLIELKTAGIIENINGSLKDSSGHNVYRFRFAFTRSGKDYYLFREYYEDTGGQQNGTGIDYAVDVMDGQCYRALWESGDNTYTLADLKNQDTAEVEKKTS